MSKDNNPDAGLLAVLQRVVFPGHDQIIPSVLPDVMTVEAETRPVEPETAPSERDALPVKPETVPPEPQRAAAPEPPSLVSISNHRQTHSSAEIQEMILKALAATPMPQSAA
jgi:hypothetical protein